MGGSLEESMGSIMGVMGSIMGVMGSIMGIPVMDFYGFLAVSRPTMFFVEASNQSFHTHDGSIKKRCMVYLPR